MFNIINSFKSFYLILVPLLCFAMLSFLFYDSNDKKLSFYFFYLTLTCGYFLVLSTKIFPPFLITYSYYFLIFIFYHLYFTVSKRFYGRIIVIINQYLNNSEYFKLIFWIVFVLITALFSELFVFLMVFNPLFGFSLATGNLMLFFFLLFLWLWMLILVYFNKLNICNNFLLKIQNYFSRRACLHFIGNNSGKALLKRLGDLVAVAPIVVSIPATVGYVLHEEATTGHFAIDKMCEYATKYPNSTPDQQYKIYYDNYKEHALSTFKGRVLTHLGVMEPAVPEVFSNYEPKLLNNLNKSAK